MAYTPNNPNGQATMANSAPIVVASNQTAIPVSAAAQPGVDIGDVTVNNGAGAAAVNVQDGGNSLTIDGAVAQSGAWNITNVSGTVSLPTGASTAALQTQPGVDIGDVTVNNAAGAAAVNIQDGGNSITVDGAVASTQSGTWNVNDVSGTVSLPTGASTAAKQPALGTAGTASADVITVQGIASMTALKVDGSAVTQPISIAAALPAGTNGIGKLTANAGVTIGAVEIAAAQTLATLTTLTGSSVAHDAADSGNPHKIGAKAIAHGANPTAVAAGDRTDLYANRAGILFTIGGHPNTLTVEAAYTGAQTDTSIITVSAGTKIVLTGIDFTCDNANTVDVGVRVGFGATNTPTTAGVVLSHPGVAPGSGISKGNGGGILGIGGDGEDLRITCEVPTTGSCRVLPTYYLIES